MAGASFYAKGAPCQPGCLSDYSMYFFCLNFIFQKVICDFLKKFVS